MADAFVVDAQGRPMIDKDPDAILDYSFTWTAWLAPDTDTILTATFPTTTNGVTVESSSVLGGTIVKVWVSGGTVGKVASVTCRITTTLGKTDERTIYFRIVNR